jgi:hypothetical protein
MCSTSWDIQPWLDSRREHSRLRGESLAQQNWWGMEMWWMRDREKCGVRTWRGGREYFCEGVLGHEGAHDETPIFKFAANWWL